MSVRRTNRFWSVSLEHTLFLDFLKLFLNMRLVISFAGKKNAFFGPTDQKLWMFKVSRRSLGRAGKCCSQFKKNGNSPTGPGINPQPAGDRGLNLNLSGCPNFFEIFLLKKNEFLEVWEMGRGFCEDGCTTPPFFEACPYTWKC
jgi:hypothetical protein